MFDAEHVEQLAQVLHANQPINEMPYSELAAGRQRYLFHIARFVLAHCDHFTAANLLAHRAQTCVEREVEG